MNDIRSGVKLEKGVKDYSYSGNEFYTAYLETKDCNIAMMRIAPEKMAELYAGFEDENRRWQASFTGIPICFSLHKDKVTIFPIPDRKDFIFKIEKYASS